MYLFIHIATKDEKASFFVVKKDKDCFSFDTFSAVCDRLKRHLAGSVILDKKGKPIDIAKLVEKVYIHADDAGAQFWYSEEPDGTDLFEIYLKGHDLEKRYSQYPSFEETLEVVLKKFRWQLTKP